MALKSILAAHYHRLTKNICVKAFAVTTYKDTRNHKSTL